MGTATHSKFYDDLDTFFTERGLRRRAGDGEWWEDSYDYGVWWYDDQGRTYRLTWIGAVGRDEGDGGELYFVRLSGPHRTALVSDMPSQPGVSGSVVALGISAGDDSGHVEYLGRIRPACADDFDSVLDRFPGSANDPALMVERMLDGWAEVCGQRDSVQWVRDRMAEAIADGRAEAP